MPEVGGTHKARGHVLISFILFRWTTRVRRSPVGWSSEAQNTVVTEFTPGPGIDAPLTMKRDGQTYTYHTDAQGSIIAITDPANILVQRYEYDAYGNITHVQAPTFKQPYAYAGREWDEESGLYSIAGRGIMIRAWGVS